MEDLILNEDILAESFIPENVVHREGQIKEIARLLSPALYNKGINNIFVIGPTGVGKTLIIRWILHDRFAKNSAYVNCWNCKSEHKIMEEILLQLGVMAHGKESTADLLTRLKMLKKKIIVCLDEADQIKEPEILYTLTRNDIGLILISNRSFIGFDMDYRIRSSILLNEIEFRPYSREELFDILKERTDYALRPGSVGDDLLRHISVMANGDARVSLLALKASARNAEANGRSSVSLEDIVHAMKGARRFRSSYLLRKLNSQQRVMYDILKKNNRISSGKLYRQYSKLVTVPVVSRAYRKYMKGMIELGLIKSDGSGRWKKYEIVV